MKNILLFFLSDIHLNDKTKEFRISPYQGLNGKEYNCIQTNESAVDYIMDYLDNKLDALFFFSTNKTKEYLAVMNEGDFVTQTHVEWFENRIIKKHPELVGSFYIVDYDENKDTEEGIRQVTAMTERIKKYLDDSGDKDIRVYADMTGGFRHASMMMLSVMQLLNQYRGIKIEKVLYSNWKKKDETAKHTTGVNAMVLKDIEKAHGEVEDVTELHRMFTLVSGTDEFVNFGSVKEIDHYFENRQKSLALGNLLDTMRAFSDAIKICRTNKIEALVRQLRSRITDFSTEPKKTVHEKIFEQIITILKEEYGLLLLPNATQLDIIEWCIKKGFLQQAMTLCTEWLPFVLVNKKICYTDDMNVKLKALEEGISWQRAWEQTFIISFFKGKQPFAEPSAGNKGKGYSFAIDNFITTNNAEESAALYPEGQGKLLELLKECKKNPKIFMDIKKDRKIIETLGNENPMIEKTCKFLWQVRKDNNQTKLGYEEFLMSKIDDVEHLLKQFRALPKDKCPELFDVSIEKEVNMDKHDATNTAKNKTKWENREAQYKCMHDDKIMQSKYPYEVMIKLLKGFHEIREERNRINHAASEQKDSKQTEIVKKTPEDLMLSYIAELRKY